jgi:hypothetical protein
MKKAPRGLKEEALEYPFKMPQTSVRRGVAGIRTITIVKL